VILTVGGVVSGGGGGGAFGHRHGHGRGGVLLPAASRAMAAMVCEPLLAEVVFQEIE